MPSKSPAQARLMQAVAHNPKFAKKAGIPTKVGQEFAEADGNFHPKAHPGEKGWNSHARTHSARSGKSGKFS